MTKPPALGDADKKFILVDEKWETPAGREPLLKMLKDIIAGGGVKKLVVENGKPILVKRYVEKGTIPEIEDAPPEDLFAAARNAEIVELSVEIGVNDLSFSKRAFKHLFQAFHMVSMRGFKASKLVVHSEKELRTWLSVDTLIDVSVIYGIEVVITEQLPEDAALVVAMVEGSTDLVAFSVKIPMMLPVEKT